MQSNIRLLTGVVLAVYAIYASFHQYPIEHFAIAILVAVILLKDVRWIRAKAGPIDFEARFGEDDDARSSRELQIATLERSRMRTDNTREPKSENWSREENDAPGD